MEILPLEIAPMRDVLTFGETMLRFSPPDTLRLSQASHFDIWVAGSESNVAVALGVFGLKATWVSRLPENGLGQKVAGELCGLGVDVSHVVWTSPQERLGLFYMEPGVAPRPAQVIYDRAYSAAAALTPGDLPDFLFDSHRHLHISGITPALSPSCAETVTYAIAQTKARGRTVSFDVNYRALLWSPEQARQVMTPLLSSIDVLLCASGDAQRVFGIFGDVDAMARALQAQFGVPVVVVTAGAEGASAIHTGSLSRVPAVPVEVTVERLGSGDAFAAGFLAGYLAGNIEQGLRQGVAAASLKRTIKGDLLRATHTEIEAILTQKTDAAWR